MPTGIYTRTKEQNCNTSKAMKKYYKDKPGTWSGKKLSDEHKEKISKSMKEYSSEKGANKWKPEIRKKMSEERRGKGNPNWKPGTERKLHKRVMASYLGRQWKSDVLTRDKYTCTVCGVGGSYMATHHKVPIIKILDKYKIETLEEALECQEVWNLNNGVTLCCSCHSKAHAEITKCVKKGKDYPKWLEDLVESSKTELLMHPIEQREAPRKNKPKGYIVSDY